MSGGVTNTISELKKEIEKLQEENDNYRRWFDDITIPSKEYHNILYHPIFTPQERLMLGILMKHMEIALTKEAILAAAHTSFVDHVDGPEIKIVTVRMTTIRQKLQQLKYERMKNIPTIETVWGLGYRATLKPQKGGVDFVNYEQLH